MSPLPNLALLLHTAIQRHRLGFRVGFPRKEEKKNNLPLVPREALAETSAMPERKGKPKFPGVEGPVWVDGKTGLG